MGRALTDADLFPARPGREQVRGLGAGSLSSVPTSAPTFFE